MKRNLLEGVSQTTITYPPHHLPTKSSCSTRFAIKTEAQAIAELRHEMRMLHAKEFKISIDATGKDPGAAIWWVQPGAPESTCVRAYACDGHRERWANMHALAASLESMRRVTRWGVITAETATAGAAILALPGAALDMPSQSPDWQAVIGVSPSASLVEAEAAWRRKVVVAHPDRGGSDEEMAALNAAISQARKDLGAGK